MQVQGTELRSSGRAMGTIYRILFLRYPALLASKYQNHKHPKCLNSRKPVRFVLRSWESCASSLVASGTEVGQKAGHCPVWAEDTL